LGVNYWDSHAAIGLWKDWREEVLQKDFTILAAHGAKVLRVFPLWDDFQPLTRLYQGDGTPQELRFGEEELPDTEAGRAGVSEVMMERFERFADLAEEHGLKLIVALITGQMTGRLFIPPGFAGLNPISSPEALIWEVRFVRYFVRRMKGHPALAAWNFGNEINYTGKAESPAEASLWMSCIANAIRLEDADHPLISGMNGNALVSKQDSTRPGHAHWAIDAQSEHCDVLTTHYYHMWTAAATDPCDTIKGVLSPVAETRLFSDVSGKPCFVEEIGMWRGANASLDTLAAYLRGVYWNLLANGGGGLLWWCAFDQDRV
ncbi:MAG: beta-mannanase, partial [Planctomycetes bacterium]|nr:beta-mannanase [Planctomycetota bacterium]